jgi:hypothetical protein
MLVGVAGSTWLDRFRMMWRRRSDSSAATGQTGAHTELARRGLRCVLDVCC